MSGRTCVHLSWLGDVGIESFGHPGGPPRLVGGDLILLDLLQLLVLNGSHGRSPGPLLEIRLARLADFMQLIILVACRLAHELKI